MNFARLGNKYLADCEPWKIIDSDPERVKTIINISLQICANLTILMEPFLPFSARKLAEMLNIPLLDWSHSGNTELIVSNHQTNKPSLLFEKIENSEIEKQVTKLLDTKKQNEADNVAVLAQKPNISFEDFAKIDIRTGTILTAEKVAKTKKLLKLTIDTGIDKRTVVSGIAEFYEPENIIGQKVLILVNLEEREIKGIKSQGMILMAEDSNGNLCFASATKDISNGGLVK
jgi:methionyl-tRNA synthetase